MLWSRTMATSLRSITGLIALLALGLGCGPGGENLGESDETETSGDGDGDPIEPDDELETVILELDWIVGAAVSHFALAQEDVPPGTPMHRCPSPYGSPVGGEASTTPGLNVNCNLGPDQKCVPEFNGDGSGIYDANLWLHNPVWQGLSFAKIVPHSFHYNFIGINAIEGYGACSFTAQAFADLDDDGDFSTYERRGTADEDGNHIDPMLYVTLAGE
jgi:hypothetical protein